MIGRRSFLGMALAAAALGGRSVRAEEARLYTKRFGAPKTRIQGGTRGGNGPVAIQVILSEETGWTASDQPVLYWFLSADTTLRIDLAVAEVGARKPLAVQRLKRGVSAGLHGFSLVEQAVRLVAGRDYVFSATLVPDPTMRTADIVSRGTLAWERHRTFNTAVEAARTGYWVDAFALADRPQQAELLDEVGLDAVASWVRAQA